MDYVEHYYELVHGCYPYDDDTNKDKTQKTIDYLLDCGIPQQDILKVIEEAPAADYLSPDLLPEWLWDNSLIKRDKFYFHSLLHIVSPPPMWDPRTGIETMVPFFMEMRIRFTMADLLQYYYRQIGPDPELRDIKRDTGALNHLLNSYSKMTMDSVDFLLHVIDYARDTHDQIRSILDLSRYDAEVHPYMTSKMAEAKFYKADRIIWR